MFKKTITFKSSYKKELIEPVPIKKLAPEWYKKLPNYYGNKTIFQDATAKKCVPMLDAFTSGYAILNPVDIIFWHETKDDKKGIGFRLPDSLHIDDYPGINVGIELHNSNQINQGFVRPDEYDRPFKYLNPWIIETPKNYSCLFINPLNHGGERGIRTLDAIVETDVYYNQVNFPFFLKKFDEKKSFLLKKGDPVMLVFPFLRDQWQMKVSDIDTDKKQHEHFNLFNNIADNYKRKIWRRKNYD